MIFEQKKSFGLPSPPKPRKLVFSPKPVSIARPQSRVRNNIFSNLKLSNDSKDYGESTIKVSLVSDFAFLVIQCLQYCNAFFGRSLLARKLADLHGVPTDSNSWPWSVWFHKKAHGRLWVFSTNGLQKPLGFMEVSRNPSEDLVIFCDFLH